MTYDAAHHTSEIAATQASEVLAQLATLGGCMACVRDGVWAVVCRVEGPDVRGWWWACIDLDTRHTCGVGRG